MKAILVGAGGIARELLRRLGESWEVTVVDTAPELLARAEMLRPARTLRGDGSSRVVLGRAGLADADAVISATNDDDTNLEACRIAREAGCSRIAAIAADPERLPDYRELGVIAISPDTLAARRLELSLESRRVASSAFAGGRAEAIEFRIAPDSPVRGKALKDLHARNFIVGVVLRGDELIVPHGDTVLRTGDLVTVVGAGAEFAEIVRMFTSGEGRFPLDFGKRVAVVLEGGSGHPMALGEAASLVRNSRASSLTLVHRDPDTLREDEDVERVRGLVEHARELAEGVELRLRPVRGRPASALAGLTEEESVGVIVVGVPRRGAPSWWRSFRGGALARKTRRPVLLARGAAPYRRILVPARRTPTGRAAVRAAIDLARFSSADLVAVAVVDPIFLAGPGPPVEARAAIAWIEEEAAVQGVNVDGVIRRGNPVRQLLDQAEGVDLVVLGIPAPRPGVLPRLGIGRLVAQHTSRSVLLVPSGEES